MISDFALATFQLRKEIEFQMRIALTTSWQFCFLDLIYNKSYFKEYKNLTLKYFYLNIVNKICINFFIKLKYQKKKEV